MSLFISTRGKSNLAIATCDRCRLKMANADMVEDKDKPGIWGHPSCMDALDPWRLPPRQSDDITVPHPRGDGFQASSGNFTVTDT